MIRRYLAKRRHKRYETDAPYRLSILHDHPWADLIGRRAWCDGVERPCRFCGDRCCDCRHTERRPRHG